MAYSSALAPSLEGISILAGANPLQVPCGEEGQCTQASTLRFCFLKVPHRVLRALHIAKVQGETSYQDDLTHSLGTLPDVYVETGGVTQYKLTRCRVEGA